MILTFRCIKIVQEAGAYPVVTLERHIWADEDGEEFPPQADDTTPIPVDGVLSFPDTDGAFDLGGLYVFTAPDVPLSMPEDDDE